MYYHVDDVTARRVRPEDGTVEYKVRWKGYKDAQDSWEPRRNVTEQCAEAVQAVDQQEMERTDARIVRWRDTMALGRAPATKRPREASAPTDDSEMEVLSGLLLRGTRPTAVPNSSPPLAKSTTASETTTPGSPTSVPTESRETASVVMLGEVVLTEDAATFLGNPAKRGRRAAGAHHGKQAEATAEENSIPELCASAVALEKSWRERFAVSLMHSCVGSARSGPLGPHFCYEATEDATAEERRLRPPDVEILGLAPVELAESGQPYQKPVTFLPWIGEDEAERLRRNTVADNPTLNTAAQDLLRPQQERMLVRYAISVVEGDSDGAPGKAQRRVAAMPLTVFREVFPQLLLDYLLEHAVVLEG